MESTFDDLIRQAKQENSVSAYLRLYQAYKSSQKFYSAQQTLERALEKLKYPEAPLTNSDFSTRLLEILTTHEEFKKIPLKPSKELYPIYSLLGDTLLLLKKPEEAVSWLYNAQLLYTPDSELNQKLYLNVLLCGLLESFISIMIRFLYLKDYQKTQDWKTYAEWLISYIKSTTEYKFVSEKLNLMIANYYFIIFTWHEKPEDFEQCEVHCKGSPNLEVQFVLTYYKDKTVAKGLVKALIMQNPGISQYWTWLAFVETEYKRKINAVNRALQLDKSNWSAWVALGLFQASRGDFISSSKTWKISHHFNHTDSKLWILSSFLYHEANSLKKSLESFKLACDMDPSIWLTIESYLSLS